MVCLNLFVVSFLISRGEFVYFGERFKIINSPLMIVLVCWFVIYHSSALHNSFIDLHVQHVIYCYM